MINNSTLFIAKYFALHSAASIMLDRGENLLHDYFGDVNYWGEGRWYST